VNGFFIHIINFFYVILFLDRTNLGGTMKRIGRGATLEDIRSLKIMRSDDPQYAEVRARIAEQVEREFKPLIDAARRAERPTAEDLNTMVY
jgi:hypothetical protein